MEVNGQLHARPPYPQGKSPLYPLDRKLGGPQWRSGRGGEGKIPQPLPGFEQPINQPLVRFNNGDYQVIWCPFRSVKIM
jgi:hypothetical protein